jgi:hypothetical protein
MTSGAFLKRPFLEVFPQNVGQAGMDLIRRRSHQPGIGQFLDIPLGSMSKK